MGFRSWGGGGIEARMLIVFIFIPVVWELEFAALKMIIFSLFFVCLFSYKKGLLAFKCRGQGLMVMEERR